MVRRQGSRRDLRRLRPGQDADAARVGRERPAETDKPVLILTPLAVSAQTIREAAKFGIEGGRSMNGSPLADHRHELRAAPSVRPVTTSAAWSATSRAPSRPSTACGARRHRLHAEDALSAALHRDGRAERLHRARHVERGARRARAHGHARPVLQERAEHDDTKGHWHGYGAPRVFAAAGDSRATPRSRSGAGSRRGRGRCADRPTSASTTTDSSCRRSSIARARRRRARTRRRGTCSTCPLWPARGTRGARRTINERCEKVAELVGRRRIGRRLVPPERRGRPARRS